MTPKALQSQKTPRKTQPVRGADYPPSPTAGIRNMHQQMHIANINVYERL